MSDDNKFTATTPNILEKISDANGNILLYISGKWQESQKVNNVYFPYDGKKYRSYYTATPDYVNEAVNSAKKTLPEMESLPLWKRAEILKQVAYELSNIAEEVAEIIVYETGKTLSDAKGEIKRTVSTLRFSADEAKNLSSETIPLDAMQGGEGRFAFSIRKPLGVLGAITGFNFPLLLSAHKLGPAFAGGNTAILKPSPETPLTGVVLAYLFEKAGLPKGALHVINGEEDVGEKITRHDEISAISFTGSSDIGKKISSQARYKKTLLELGSNAATIVDDTSNLNLIVDKIITGGFSAVGQSCISVQRVIVHENIYTDLIKKLTYKMSQLKIGNPFNNETDIPTVLNQKANQRILNWIEEAQKEGGDVKIGGKVEGRILKPTLISDVNSNMKVFQEEIFGPVITITPFRNINDAINLVNKSKYGLQAGVFTNNLENAWTAINNIEAGSVHINEVSNFRADHMPYGGVKDSGIGKEGPKYVLNELTTLKVVSFKI